MDKVIDQRFEKVEKALTALINSIATYNPTPELANKLVAADEELNEGLEQLSAHQSNYNRIIALRNTSATLDSQIRDTLTLLTTTRTDLLATPATVFPENTNPVSSSELLSYARRISKFTRPPTYREAEPAPATENHEGAVTGNATPKDKSGSQTNGTSTPVAVTNGAEKDGNLMEVDTTAVDAPATSGTALPTQLAAWIDPLADQNFVPWPTEDKLRRGALASIQILMDRGLDPATFDPEKSAELEAERKRITEEEDAAREIERERVELERRREIERRMSATGGSTERAAHQPKQFSLDTFEDDDDSS